MSNDIFVGKLFSESIVEDIKTTEEGKDLYIQGLFAKGNHHNENGRVYPTEVLKESFDIYKREKIDKNRAYGELTHPQSPELNLERVCIMMTDVKQDGDNFYGKAKVLSDELPMAKILRGILKSGGQVGVSTRGLGSADEATIGGRRAQRVNQYILRCVDVVADPSVNTAYVEAIEESKDYILDKLSGEVVELNESTYARFESRIKDLPIDFKRKNEVLYESVVDFLNSLRAPKDRKK